MSQYRKGELDLFSFTYEDDDPEPDEDVALDEEETEFADSLPAEDADEEPEPGDELRIPPDLRGDPEDEEDDDEADEDAAEPDSHDPEQQALFDLDELEWWREYWRGMPELDQEDQAPWQTVYVHFRCRADRERFAKLVGQKITDHGKRTRSIWFPEDDRDGRMANKRFIDREPTGPRYPVFVPTKGRYETMYTIRSLEEVGVPYRAVVVEEEAEEYASRIDPDLGDVLVLPPEVNGLVPTRNWIWDLARDEGTARFWTMDDNIKGFFRLYKNIKTPIASGGFLRVMEDFVERFENIPIAGMNYFMFASRKTVVPPIYANTRVYSNMLIDTFVEDPDGKPYRNEGFYNDDTDLCLRILKDGLCTILFNVFLIGKSTTMKVKGGMTPHYQDDGRLRMAKELAEKHPDVTTVTEKWGRAQHHVDYSRFKRNRLILRDDAEIPDGEDDFGMVLQDLVDGEWVDRPKEDG